MPQRRGHADPQNREIPRAGPGCPPPSSAARSLQDPRFVDDLRNGREPAMRDRKTGGTFHEHFRGCRPCRLIPPPCRSRPARRASPPPTICARRCWRSARDTPASPATARPPGPASPSPARATGSNCCSKGRKRWRRARSSSKPCPSTNSTIPRQLVADAAVMEVDHRLAPEPRHGGLGGIAAAGRRLVAQHRIELRLQRLAHPVAIAVLGEALDRAQHALRGGNAREVHGDMRVIEVP